VPDFIAEAKANPGKINMGSGGIGSTGHVAGELFQMMASTKFAHVPYRGEAPALTDLIGGQVQVVFTTAGSTLEYLKAGTLRALAVTSSTRMSVLPDVPPVADFLPGYEASSWIGVGAPTKTPGDIIATLNRAIDDALANRKNKAQLEGLGASAMPGSPADFGKFIGSEVDKWAKVIKFSGAKQK